MPFSRLVISFLCRADLFLGLVALLLPSARTFLLDELGGIILNEQQQQHQQKQYVNSLQ